MSTSKRLAIVTWTFLCFLAPSGANAIVAPAPGVRFPRAFYERRATQPTAFTFTRSLIGTTKRVQANRARVMKGQMTAAAAAAAGGTAISGSRQIPVLLSKFTNSPAADPFPVPNLQRELFDGPWPTGTMTDFYKEISYGRFSVTGTVFPWRKLANDDAHYEGGAGCNGLCNTSKVGDFLKQTLDANDAAIDFGKYDNDGPDGVANSGDDDGFVDFVAFVHPESGGECGNDNIWSHRWIYGGWTGGADYTTNDAKSGGGSIKISDYVIMPAFACDGSTMIQIGVFCHEFGHAFGLPDLYDTDNTNGDSEGIGNWCLMASGSWGGDGHSPERPTHMSAWAKEFLGWVNPIEVTADLLPATIENIEEKPVAYKIPISATQYYLVSNRQKKLFDAKLPAGGLLIWHINQTVVDSGLTSNRVNADETNKGVDLEEADGRADLDNAANRGDAGDVFPGSEDKRFFDTTTNPKSVGTVAICNISDSGDTMTAALLKSTGKCSGPTKTPSTAATKTPTVTSTPIGGGLTPTATATAVPPPPKDGGGCFGGTTGSRDDPPRRGGLGAALLALPALLALLLVAPWRRIQRSRIR